MWVTGQPGQSAWATGSNDSQKRCLAIDECDSLVWLPGKNEFHLAKASAFTFHRAHFCFNVPLK